MASKSVYVCSQCGYETVKWLGKCPGCGAFSTMEEQAVQPETKNRRGQEKVSRPAGEMLRLRDVSTAQQDRFSSGSAELDRVLGGGIVPASIVLCGGDPGIGKSTLLLQVCDFAAQKQKVIYVSAEESARQIKLRADRLKADADQLYLYTETDIDDIIDLLTVQKPGLAVVDSIQTVYASYLSGAPGTVSQVRECASRLMRLAKEEGIAVITVGHVTKEGTLAGPKVLEHIVDTVMYFEGEKNSAYRILRAAKNRFGSTNEIGVFEMTEEGMCDVDNPSELFLSGRTEPVPGTVTFCSVEGTRPMMVEIQALTGTGGFTNPRRVGSGVDYNRMVTLMAVLEKRLGYTLYNQDVYVNVAGGLHIDEPALDLPLIGAVASAYKGTVFPADTVLFGEVGLTGELRAVNAAEQRIAECARLGFTKVILPEANRRSIHKTKDIQILYAKNIFTALSMALVSHN